MEAEKILEFKQEQRICKSCKEQKSVVDFQRIFKSTGVADYTSKKCNECFKVSERQRQKKLWANDAEYREQHNAKGKEYRKVNPDKRDNSIKGRPDRVKRLYGVTYEHVVQTLANQFGRCANHGCSKEISLEVRGVQKNRAVIDHDHKTGKFRAVLCVDCNCLLGQLETKSEKVLGLMDYINKYK